MIVICDIDGTAADCAHRRHFVESQPKNWDAFYDACADDKPIAAIKEILLRLCGGGGEPHAVFYVSGRRESIRGKTVRWLDAHGFPSGPLFIRKDGDFRQDNIVKREILHNEILAHNTKEEILCVLEDRKQVVDMWRSEGLLCLQVADGNF